MESFRIFTPSPILGYGYDLDEFWTTVNSLRPAAIIVDGGSTDPGPYMLGTDKTICSRASYLRDMAPMLEASARYGMKLLVGSAGGAGTNSQVDFMVDIVRELAEKHGWSFKIATIKFRDDRSLFSSKVRFSATSPCGPGPQLREEDVADASQIVGQMGAEPFLKVLEDSTIDIIMAGRSYDPAPFAAFAMHHGVERSSAWHMGKIMECGGLCALPKGRSMVATMHRDSFVLSPSSPAERCTPLSVAAHTFYEKTRPDRLPGPGGSLFLDRAIYRQQPDGRSVLVKGATFVPAPLYQVKLEGVKHLGHRTIFIGGIRDPILIQGLDDFLRLVQQTVQQAFPSVNASDTCRLVFHVYGRNGVMGPLESMKGSDPHELGILGEVLAPTQEDADAVAGFARVTMLHGSYEGQIATGGNLASPLTPLEQSAGPVFQFSIYHLLDIADPLALFSIDTLTVGMKKVVPVVKLNANPNPKPNPTGKTVSSQSRERPPKNVPSGPCTIKDIASIVRSKNSGPFEITLDILFDRAEHFHRVKESGVLNAETIKKLYRALDEDIITLMFFEPALGWKCTLRRSWPQGSFGERDTFGTQQHAPLLSIPIPGSFVGAKL
ncbi:hypothetical protein N7474_007980 [Penicillium riverlandense]|uniref:uncharacterized protein n=1 Tax=Penicillium riverlandense TaxID=1903569 RepID=UPI002547578C|nr:uncharacterized protein N7474_007980 [Penicillium riverlandense]KAJ5811679.1 hypothetical protein N7474_007980 [Penicillium riverlandense]